MSIKFAEKILDSMVDENGHCGERGLSPKQFDALSGFLERGESEWAGAWHGNRHGGHINFYSTDYTGNIGKYAVVLNEFWHFNPRYTVKSIDLRPKDEYEREMHLKNLGKFEHSEWVGKEGSRMELELTLVRVYEYERQAYGYSYGYHPETVHIYTLADAEGNCFVWKSANHLGVDIVKEVCKDGSERLDWVPAEPGDKVRMKATVKEHNEYKGIKQTVINRPKVKEVVKSVA